jgi:hypothetical protein
MENNQKNIVGIFLGAVVIIAIIVLVIVTVKQKNQTGDSLQEDVTPYNIETDQVIKKLETQGTSDEVKDIESDIVGDDFGDLESDILKDIDELLNL